jgi:hypothetical protein
MRIPLTKDKLKIGIIVARAPNEGWNEDWVGIPCKVIAIEKEFNTFDIIHLEDIPKQAKLKGHQSYGSNNQLYRWYIVTSNRKDHYPDWF